MTAAGAVGALAGAATAIFFTGSLCNGTSADSFCGLIGFAVLPLWTLGGAVAGAVIGGSVEATGRVSGAEWLGSVVGASVGVSWRPVSGRLRVSIQG